MVASHCKTEMNNCQGGLLSTLEKVCLQKSATPFQENHLKIHKIEYIGFLKIILRLTNI